MGKTKYSLELKLEIVKHYIDDHISINQLSRRYLVNRGDIQKWVDSFQEHGIEGLMHTRQSYTGDFKVSVIEYLYT